VQHGPALPYYVNFTLPISFQPADPLFVQLMISGGQADPHHPFLVKSHLRSRPLFLRSHSFLLLSHTALIYPSPSRLFIFPLTRCTLAPFTFLASPPMLQNGHNYTTDYLAIPLIDGRVSFSRTPLSWSNPWWRAPFSFCSLNFNLLLRTSTLKQAPFPVASGSPLFVGSFPISPRSSPHTPKCTIDCKTFIAIPLPGCQGPILAQCCRLAEPGDLPSFHHTSRVYRSPPPPPSECQPGWPPSPPSKVSPQVAETVILPLAVFGPPLSLEIFRTCCSPVETPPVRRCSYPFF